MIKDFTGICYPTLYTWNVLDSQALFTEGISKCGHFPEIVKMSVDWRSKRLGCRLYKQQLIICVMGWVYHLS